MTRIDRSEQELEELLQSAAKAGPDPSDALLARVMADADAVLAERSAESAMPVGSVPTSASGGWLNRLLGGVGGWPAVAGLATATIAGVWIGYAQPASLGGVAGGLLAGETAYDLGDLLPDYDSVLAGG